jgi:UDP-N-acetylmuramyl pentapeptide phosphotransferase/UDP-N-acetylglucosamine-1-phosphate transferase
VLERWVLAFTIATTVALLVTPRLARMHHSESARVPLLTAATPPIAVIAGSLVVVSHVSTRLAVGLLAAVWLWFAGQLADRGQLPRPIRRITLLLAAGAITASGLRLRVTGQDWSDVVATVLLVWVALSAWRSAETRDNLLLGWACAIAAGAGVVGGLAGQLAIAAIAAATVGACAGFFPYVLPPVAARLRSGGAQFLGAIVIVLALDARPQVPAPGAAAVVLLLLALPLLDAVLVGSARLRDPKADPMDAGIAGRWRLLGAPRLPVIIGLVVVQAGLSFVAVLVARTLLVPWIGALIALATMVLISVPTLAVRGRWTRHRFPRWVLIVAALVVFAGALLTVPAAIEMWRARSDATAAAESIRQGLDAVRAGDPSSAAAAFNAAAAHFDDAHRRLTDPSTSLALHIPVIGPNLQTGRQLADIGAALSRTGQQLTTTADVQKLKINDGTVDLAEVERLEPELAATTGQLEAARSRVRGIDRNFLVTPLDDAIGKLLTTLNQSIHEGRTATLAAQLLPSILGGDGTRLYVLAMQNPAEARATGGIFGSWAELTATNGHLELGLQGKSDVLNAGPEATRVLHAPADYQQRYARFAPEDVWQNVNVSPDLPTVGKVALNVWAQAGMPPADGLIAVDPVGLSSILRVTGPITVADWPTPITADNVVDITLKQAYVRFANDQQARDDFLGDVTTASWKALSSRDLGSPTNLLKALGAAVQQKHIMLWFTRGDEEALAQRAGASGAVPGPTGDTVFATMTNAAANKLDVYLQRSLDYNATLDPQANGQVAVEGTIGVGLKNAAPAGGLPLYVEGPNTGGLVAGDNRTFVSIYTPLALRSAAINGSAAAMESGRELGRWVFSNFLTLPAGAQRTTTLAVRGTEKLAPGGSYQLTIPHEAGLQPTPTNVNVHLPDGWRFIDAKGLRISADGHDATFSGSVNRDLVLRAKVVRDYGSGLWGLLEAGANRAGH